MLVLIILLAASPLQVQSFFIPSLSDLKTLFEISYDIYSKLNEVHDTYNKFQTTASLEDIMNTVAEISRDVNAIGAKIEKKLDVIVESLMKRLPLVQKIDADARALYDDVVRIDGLYQDFETYVKDRDEFNNATLQDFAQAITSHRSNDVNSILIHMHGLVIPGRGAPLKKSFVLLLSEETQMNRNTLCDTGASPQQRLFGIYKTIVLTELRAYTMMAFAYTLRSSFEKGQFMREVLHREKQFEKRVEQYLYVFTMAMKWTPTTLRRCDPQTHERDVTFLEFERFVQAYIAQEDALNSNHECYGECNSQPKPTRHYYDCDGYECRGSAQTCDGAVTVCFSGVNRMQICPVYRNPPKRWNPRRYLWYKDGNGRLYGSNNDGCPGKTDSPEWFWKHTWYSCDVCQCTCVDDSPRSESYHFVSLREVLSDIEKNLVVTGVRFIRKNWVVQIQIQQGELSRDGTINSSTISWKESEDIWFEAPQSKGWDQFHFTKHTSDYNYPTLHKDKDIAVFDFKHRTINLDELKAPQNHCITGVKFSLGSGEKPNISPLQLEIRTTAFDYTEGKVVNPDDSTWINPKDMADSMKAYQRKRDKIQQWSYSRSPVEMLTTVPDFDANKYIEIWRTGLQEDAGQTVIPMLDALEVAANPAVPLSGLQLFHKRADGYGGFVSFQIQSVNRTPYTVLPNKDD